MRSQGKSSRIYKGDVISLPYHGTLQYYVVLSRDEHFIVGRHYFKNNKYIMSYQLTHTINSAKLIAKSNMFRSDKEKKEYVAVLNALYFNEF